MATFPTLDHHPDWTLSTNMGWSVLPIRQSKHETRDNWKQPATAWKHLQERKPTSDEWQAWAKNGHGVGVVTGAISGLVVLDLDSAAAIEEATRLGLPETLTVLTHKGKHLYFRHPGGIVGNRTGIFPGADIRGDGG